MTAEIIIIVNKNTSTGGGAFIKFYLIVYLSFYVPCYLASRPCIEGFPGSIPYGSFDF